MDLQEVKEYIDAAEHSLAESPSYTKDNGLFSAVELILSALKNIVTAIEYEAKKQK